MTVSGQQVAEAGMPTVPVFEVAPLAGIASVDSSACACWTDSRHRLRVIIVDFSKRGSLNNRGSRNASFGTLHITEGLAAAGVGVLCRECIRCIY